MAARIATAPCGGSLPNRIFLAKDAAAHDYLRYQRGFVVVSDDIYARVSSLENSVADLVEDARYAKEYIHKLVDRIERLNDRINRVENAL